MLDFVFVALGFAVITFAGKSDNLYAADIPRGCPQPRIYMRHCPIS